MPRYVNFNKNHPVLLDEIHQDSYLARQMDIQRHCGKCPSRLHSIFRDLTGDRLHQLDEFKTTNHYKKGQNLFYEGNEAMGLFCVTFGLIKVFKTGEEGKDVLLRLAKGGDILGLRGVLTGRPYNVTAKVVEDSTVCFVDRAYFNQLIESDHDLALRVLRRVSDELDQTEIELSDRANKTVAQRFAQLLLALSKTHGVQDANGTLINVNLTRAELASMVGATPETIIRLLSAMQDRGDVELRGKRIVVSNLDGLAETTNLET